MCDYHNDDDPLSVAEDDISCSVCLTNISCGKRTPVRKHNTVELVYSELVCNNLMKRSEDF